MFVDVSQQESAVSLIGGEVLAYQIAGQEPERMGNHSPYFAPQNAYLCAGADRWVTIAVTTDAQWRQLAEALGRPELADDDRFATNAARLQRRQELDRIIGEWAANLDMWELTQQLQERGIPAGPVLRGPDLLDNPHYTDRATFNYVDHPQAGPKWYQGFAWRMSKTPGQVHWPSPTLGQHNRQIYRELLGLTDREIDGLEENGVIGTKPTGSRII
jgi:benzylsuccinate CoA-transferase BbsF subunit